VERRAPLAGEVNREVLRRLPHAEGPPIFLYVHYMEPHAGYAPPRRYLERIAPDAGAAVSSDDVVALVSSGATLDARDRQRWIDLYDGEIAAVDAAIGALLDELAARGFAQNAVVVLVSDHGEEFDDHGGWFHALTLYDESLHVPLIFRDGRRDASGVRRDDPVDLLDVPTTLLALAGVAARPGMQGRDLLAAEALAPRDLVAELHTDPPFEDHVRRREQRIAVTRWPWKLIANRDGARVVYRLDRDGQERVALAPETPGVPPDLLAVAAEIERESAAMDAVAPRSELDPATVDGLRALGYAE
jgi:arylsulfatase A-like enzyme